LEQAWLGLSSRLSPELLALFFSSQAWLVGLDGWTQIKDADRWWRQKSAESGVLRQKWQTEIPRVALVHQQGT
jgi:hypothetical protein